MNSEITVVKKNREKYILFLISLLTLALFAVDLAFPAGVAAGLLQLAPIILIVLLGSRTQALYLAAFCSGLVVLDPVLSHPVLQVWIVATNRLLTLFALWAVTVVGLKYVRRQRDLMASEERFRLQYEGIPVPTYTWQKQGNDMVLIGFNEASRTISKGKIAGLVGSKLKEMFAGSPLIWEDFDHCLREGFLQREMQHRLITTGELKDLDVSYVRVATDLVMVHTKDVSERKRFEQELEIARQDLERQIEQRTRALKQTSEELMKEVAEHRLAADQLREQKEFVEAVIDTAQAIILILDPQARIVRFNRFFEELSGYSLKEVRGKDWFITFLPERDHLRIREVFNKAISETPTRGNVNPIVTRNGEERHIEWYSTMLKSRQGEVIGLLSLGTDITERREAEEALSRAYDDLELRVQERSADLRSANELLLQEIAERKEIETTLRRSEARLEEAQRIAHLGHWDWDVITNELIWSDEIYRIFGLQPQKFAATYEAFLQRVHQDDLRMVMDAVNDALYSGAQYSIDHRIVLPNGDVRIVHEQAQVTFNPEGGPLRMLGTVQDVTARKKAEEALRNAEARYRVLFEQSPNGIILVDAEEGKTLETNEAVQKQLGYTREELAALRVSDFEALETPKETQRHIQKVLSEGSDDFETLHRTKNGEIRNIHVSAKKLQLGERITIYGIFQDITNRKRAETQLQESEERFRQIVENIDIVFWMTTPRSDRVFYLSPAFETIWGRSREEVCADPTKWIEWTHPDDRERIWETFQASPTQHSTEKRIIRPDGSMRWVHVRVFPVPDEAGVVTRVAGIASDITERKASELERARITQELTRSLAEKDVLVKELHHRVKNNLQVVSSLLFMQARRIGDPRLRKMFEESHDRIFAMSLIHEMLYRSDRLSEIIFSEYLTRLAEGLATTYRNPAQRIQVEIAADELLVDISIAIPTGLIVNELITNAFKYAFADGRDGKILVVLRREETGRLCLSVADDGIGLPEGAEHEKAGGLGFALVRTLAQQLRGSLEVSRSGGTSVRLRFSEVEPQIVNLT